MPLHTARRHRRVRQRGDGTCSSGEAGGRKPQKESVRQRRKRKPDDGTHKTAQGKLFSVHNAPVVCGRFEIQVSEEPGVKSRGKRDELPQFVVTSDASGTKTSKEIDQLPRYVVICEDDEADAVSETQCAFCCRPVEDQLSLSVFDPLPATCIDPPSLLQKMGVPCPLSATATCQPSSSVVVCRRCHQLLLEGDETYSKFRTVACRMKLQWYKESKVTETENLEDILMSDSSDSEVEEGVALWGWEGLTAAHTPHQGGHDTLTGLNKRKLSNNTEVLPIMKKHRAAESCTSPSVELQLEENCSSDQALRHSKVSRQNHSHESSVNTTICRVNTSTLPCPVCHLKFNNQSSLSLHILNHTVNNQNVMSQAIEKSSWLSCPFCFMKCSKRGTLYHHMLKHKVSKEQLVKKHTGENWVSGTNREATVTQKLSENSALSNHTSKCWRDSQQENSSHEEGTHSDHSYITRTRTATTQDTTVLSNSLHTTTSASGSLGSNHTHSICSLQHQIRQRSATEDMPHDMCEREKGDALSTQKQKYKYLQRASTDGQQVNPQLDNTYAPAASPAELSHKTAMMKSGKKSLVCSHCHRQFLSQIFLINHITMVHNQQDEGENMTVVCELCGVSCSSTKHFNNHLVQVHCNKQKLLNTKNLTHTTEKSHNGRYSSENKSPHNTTQTKPSSTQQFTCLYCSMTFRQQCALDTHQHNHHPNQEWQCQECGAGFSQYQSLQQHKLHIHTRQDYQCDQCGGTFPTPMDLSVHWPHCYQSQQEAVATITPEEAGSGTLVQEQTVTEEGQLLQEIIIPSNHDQLITYGEGVTVTNLVTADPTMSHHNNSSIVLKQQHYDVLQQSEENQMQTVTYIFEEEN